MSRIFRKAGSSAPVPSSLYGSEVDRTSRIYYEEEEERPPLPSTSAARIAENTLHTSNGDNGSMKSIPVSIGRRLTKKGSIPSDWKDLQNLHLKEQQREEAKLSGKLHSDWSLHLASRTLQY